MARSKLRSALNRYQGKDLKLERQKKQQKEAEKRKKARTQHTEADEDLQEAGGVALDAVDQEVDLEDRDEEDWESEEDEDDDDEDTMGFNLSRLNDSDSESEEEYGDNGEIISTNGKQQLAKDPATSQEDDIPLSDLSSASDADDIVPHQRLTINNTTALERALSSFAIPLTTIPFSEHQSITTSQPIEIPDVEDELNRELAFYSQSLSSAKAARALLQKEGTPFTRPTDYFAEMVKSDEHMGKVKAKLVDEAAGKRAAQEARKQRDLKKFGKQVQQEKLKERAKDKKDMLDKVKLLKRKRQGSGVEGAREEDIFDVALDDAATAERKGRTDRRAKPGARGGASGGARGGESGGPPNAKRAKKDEKFGFGGKKKFKKSGDAISSGDMSGFSSKKMKGQPAGRGGAGRGGGGRGGSKRLGKSRRSAMQ